ncbi:hypothetical protein VPH35_100155 [Triticum aestivum]
MQIMMYCTEVVRCLGDLLATGVMTPDVRQRAGSRTSQTPGRGRRGDDGVLRRVRAARRVEGVASSRRPRARVAWRGRPGGAACRREVRGVVVALIAEIMFIRWMEVSSLGCVGAWTWESAGRTFD